MDLSDYNDHDYKLGRICMRRLHVLNTEGIVMKRIWERVELPNILWLRWVNCPHSSLPSLIPMKKLKNLKFLRLSGSELNTLWERESDSQAYLLLWVFLEVLNTNGCVKLKRILGMALGS